MIFKVKLTNIRILSESGKDMTSQSVRSYRAELQKKNLFQNKMTEMTKKLVWRLCRINPEKLCQHVEKSLAPYLKPATPLTLVPKCPWDR